MSNVFPIILFQTFSTVFMTFLYNYVKKGMIDQNEHIKTLTYKIINMEEHIAFLRYTINDLEEKIDNNERMMKSHSDLDNKLKEYIHYNFDTV